MAAARQRAFNGRSTASGSRNAAYAAISVNWKKMRPDVYNVDESRDERLEWIGKFLGIEDLRSMTDLSDQQLGTVAGEMKRLTGHGARTPSSVSSARPTSPNVITGDFTREAPDSRPETHDSETVFLSSPEMVYTIEKLLEHIAWKPDHRDHFLRDRFGTSNLRMLTFAKAKKAVTTFLRIAAHRDLKIRKGGDKAVSRGEIERYIPVLKRELQIDRRGA